MRRDEIRHGRRAVVEDEQLAVVIVLREEQRDRPRDERAPIGRRHDAGDERGATGL
jgi:hypothetical protein